MDYPRKHWTLFVILSLTVNQRTFPDATGTREISRPMVAITNCRPHGGGR
jgi:hypothetical protein